MNQAFSIGPLRIAVLASVAALAAPCWAQYKIVDADGRVTYTDRPVATGNARVQPISRGGTVAAAAPAAAPERSNAALPLELRQAASRYPVQLYTTADCAPCDSARALLVQRGVPFTERKVVTEEDVEALQRQLGWRSVPSVTIGAQALRGFNAGEWAGFLDAAGYPSESRLPRGWQAAAATPLTAPRATAAAPRATEVAAAPPAPPPIPVAPPPTGGIRF